MFKDENANLEEILKNLERIIDLVEKQAELAAELIFVQEGMLIFKDRIETLEHKVGVP